jgi:hypothetical protein
MINQGELGACRSRDTSLVLPSWPDLQLFLATSCLKRNLSLQCYLALHMDCSLFTADCSNIDNLIKA